MRNSASRHRKPFRPENDVSRPTAKEQTARNLAIVRARARGFTWTTIGESYGMTPRRAQQIVNEWRDEEEIDQPDAYDDVLDEIRLVDARIESFATLADETKNDSVRLGALKAMGPAQATRLDLKRAIGLLPSQLHNALAHTTILRLADELHAFVLEMELELDEAVFDEFERKVIEILQEDPAATRARKTQERAEKQLWPAKQRRSLQAERQRAEKRASQQRTSAQPSPDQDASEDGAPGD